MKKRVLFTAAVAAFLAMGATAQTEAGKILVGGSSNMSFASGRSYDVYDGTKDKDSEIKATSYNFTPSVGYFIFDNFAITLSVNNDLLVEKDNVGSKTKYGSTSFGPGVKYFFGTANVKPYVMGNVLLGASKMKYEDNDGDSFDASGEAKYKLFNHNVGGGVAIFLNDYVAIDLGLGYTGSIETNKDDTKDKYRESGVVFNGGITVVF